MSSRKGWLLALGFTLTATSAGSVAQADEVFVSSMEDGEEVDRFVDPQEVGSVRAVERTKFLADLAAKGVEVSWPRVSTSPVPPALTAEQRKTRKLQRVLEHAEAQPEDELVEVLVAFDEIPFHELADLRSMDPTRREEVLRQREEAVRGAQNGFIEYARGQGALILDSIWLVNHLWLAVPARLAGRILSHPDVEDVYPAWYEGTVDWDGRQIRDQTYLQRFVDMGFYGEGGGRVDASASLGDDNIKIAIIEGQWQGLPNYVNDTHKGWLDWSGGPSRLVWRVDCSLPTCPTDTASHVDWAHSTIVAWTAAGSIQQGQDPDCVAPGNCSSTERERRSGVAREAALFYIRPGTTVGSVSNALMLAFLGGADVANLSISFYDCGFCVAETDCGLEDMIRTVTDGGMLVVTSAGNRNNDMGFEYPESLNCNVGYPGQLPEVVTVGGIGSENASGSYASQPIGDYSNRGWVSVGLGGSLSGSYPIDMPVVALTAPGVVEYYFTSAQNRYSSLKLQGTSFSAPVIAAGAGLFRESMPYSSPDARMLKALLMVMGDGTGSRYLGTGSETGSSETYGSGKFKAHRFHNLEDPSGNVRWKFTISEAQQKTLKLPLSGSPLPSGVTQWKWAAYIDETDLTQVPYLFVTVTDPCNYGAVLASDNYLALHKHVFLTSAAWPPGACPEVSVYGYSVPPGGVTVYAAAYYHSGNPNEH